LNEEFSVKAFVKAQTQTTSIGMVWMWHVTWGFSDMYDEEYLDYIL